MLKWHVRWRWSERWTIRECDDGFVDGDGSLWVHVMSVEYRNAIDKVAYTLFCMNCPGFVCLSRVRAVTDNVIFIYIYIIYYYIILYIIYII